MAMAYRQWLMPTRILIVNALPAQRAEIALNNNCSAIRLSFSSMEEVQDFSGHDAIVLFGRGLFLDEDQQEALERAASKGVPIFTREISHSRLVVNRNITEGQRDTLQTYLENACLHNYCNVLLYLRHLATPHRLGHQDFEAPVVLPDNMLYHREYGQYFEESSALTAYLKAKGLYNDGGRSIALVAGINFPVEGSRAHIDTLIVRLTREGFNVYPIAGTGKGRERLIRQLEPDAILHLAVGRLGSDSLTDWLHSRDIPIFVPFPFAGSHEEWLDEETPIGGGILTARVVIPEIDGGVYPVCIATQRESDDGYLRLMPVEERINALVSHLKKYMVLRDKPNREKRIATICYFKKPGNDALIASGMEVVPSLYNFLKRLRQEGYDVSGLPPTEVEFAERLHRDGAVMGSYAKGAQERFMQTAHPVWLSSEQYEQWARETLTPEKYKEVVERYGDAPGSLLSRNDSLAVACLRYGNVILFPQPRPALGDDDFKLVHGAKVAPPHSYIAPYLYMSKGFGADAIIHFGTHGNLEFTPGKNVGLSGGDWADALLAHLPHFYFYTTGNVGEAVIAKRRTHGNLVSYLTPPYAESGMRQRYASLLADIHKALEGEGGQTLGLSIKRQAIKLGLHRDLGLDSIADKPYSEEELEQLDDFTEEIANEKMLGAYYTLGQPYSEQDLRATITAVAADPLAYSMASKDRDKGKITTDQLKDYRFVAHHYLASAKRRIESLLSHMPVDTSRVAEDLRPIARLRDLLLSSTQNEMDQMVSALNGGSLFPAPGGDPVLNPNVLPTGRNMYSINAETTPNEQAWTDGKRLAEETLAKYKEAHGSWPRKVSYTLWAGEFISTEGATIAQVLWMMGVEPVRDSQGRVIDLRLASSADLGRPRVDVVVQVSGQLRDIAASRLKLLTEAVRLASEAQDEAMPNYVKEGTLAQEARLVESGVAPRVARDLSVMRVFGPLNSGYSTGIMGYAESSGSWEDESEIARGYINNMGATYGDDDNWSGFQKDLFSAALDKTDVVVQPRQSNTWGPISLDHVYEFTGGLSLAVKTITGKEPDAYMADYRNRHARRLQEAKEAIAVETRSTLLNPTYIMERMKGGAGTAEMFGKLFRNIFGWNVMRPSSLDPELYDDLYDIYIKDSHGLGLHDYFSSVNPAALQTITAVMMESARKGYWNASEEQLQATANLHAQITEQSGAACTEFVCGNEKLDQFISSNLSSSERKAFQETMDAMRNGSQANGQEMVLKSSDGVETQEVGRQTLNAIAIALVVVTILLAVVIIRKRRKG